MHSPGEIRPFDAARAESLLARLDGFDVVRRGEPARSQEGQEGIEAAAQPRAGLPGGDQLPRRHVHAGGAGGLEHPDGDGHDVVDDQVGEYQQVAGLLAHPEGLVETVAGDELVLDALHLGAGLLAVTGMPHGDGPPVPGVVLHDAVSVAEGTAEPPAVAGGRRLSPGGAGHVVEEAPVREGGVVGVDAVLGQQLPVGLDAVAVRAGDDPHAAGVLVGDEVDVLGGPGQVLAQRFGAAVEADEDEAPEAVEARRAEPHGGPVEIGAVPVSVGHADERPRRVEGPGVVEAPERLGVAPVGAADEGAPVGARVVEHRQLAVPGAGEEQRALGHHAPGVVAGVRHLRLVSQVEPAAVEDALPLQLVDGRRHHGGTMHPEPAQVGAVADQTADVHGASLSAGPLHPFTYDRAVQESAP